MASVFLLPAKSPMAAKNRLISRILFSTVVPDSAARGGFAFIMYYLEFFLKIFQVHGIQPVSAEILSFFL